MPLIMIKTIVSANSIYQHQSQHKPFSWGLTYQSDCKEWILSAHARQRCDTKLPGSQKTLKIAVKLQSTNAICCCLAMDSWWGIDQQCMSENRGNTCRRIQWWMLSCTHIQHDTHTHARTHAHAHTHKVLNGICLYPKQSHQNYWVFESHVCASWNRIYISRNSCEPYISTQ